MREPHSTITQNKLVSVNRRREIKFLAEVNFINKELALKKSTKELKEQTTYSVMKYHPLVLRKYLRITSFSQKIKHCVEQGEETLQRTPKAIIPESTEVPFTIKILARSSSVTRTTQRIKFFPQACDGLSRYPRIHRKHTLNYQAQNFFFFLRNIFNFTEVLNNASAISLSEFKRSIVYLKECCD